MGTSYVSLVLRLQRKPAVEGELVGAAEVVDTGESVVIHSAADLLELASRVAGQATSVGETGGRP